jgi:ADP-ribose pyrophosphatase YjhB (NUDIX family)
VSDPRAYPDRPYLAVSAGIVHNGKALIVRRAQPPARGLYTLPGGVVEIGETLFDALNREVREETALTIKPIALAGHREMITRDAAGRVERHFVILCFAARLVSGTATPNDEEIAEILWCKPADLTGLHTTDGLGEIIAAAFTLLGDTP